MGFPKELWSEIFCDGQHTDASDFHHRQHNNSRQHRRVVIPFIIAIVLIIISSACKAALLENTCSFLWPQFQVLVDASPGDEQITVLTLLGLGRRQKCTMPR